MGQKMHPMIFRQGVERNEVNPLSMRATYSETGDLIGPAYESTATTKHHESDTFLRNQQRRRVRRTWAYESGRLLNQLKITRSYRGVTVYADVYRREDPTLLFGPLGWREADAEDGMEEGVDLNRLLSEQMEHGLPVTVNVALLNELLPEYEDDAPSSFPFYADLRNLVDLVSLVPCAPVFSEAVALRRSGGREHAPVMRACQELLDKKDIVQPTRDSSTEKGSLSVDPRKTEPSSRSRAKPQASGFYGYRLVFKGRMSGSERFRTVAHAKGSRPRHTLSAGMDYGRAEAQSPSGLVSVRRFVRYA